MKMSARPVTALCLALVLFAATPGATAHHSAVMYANDAVKTLTGTVKAFRWVNPHSTLEFIADGEGEEAGKLWIVEMSSPGVLTRAGWTKRTFNPGDHVSVEFAPLKDGRPGGLFRKAKLANGTTIEWSFKPGEQPGV